MLKIHGQSELRKYGRIPVKSRGQGSEMLLCTPGQGILLSSSLVDDRNGSAFQPKQAVEHTTAQHLVQVCDTIKRTCRLEFTEQLPDTRNAPMCSLQIRRQKGQAIDPFEKRCESRLGDK